MVLKQTSEIAAKRRLRRKIRPRLLVVMDAIIKEPAKAPRPETLIKSPCRALDSPRLKNKEPITGHDVSLPKIDTSIKKISFVKIGSKNIYGMERTVAMSVRKSMANTFALYRM